MLVKLTDQQLEGYKKILDWAPANFHKLTQDNKVKIWLKVYDKAMPEKLNVELSLAQAIKKARDRSLAELV